jgi:GDPmannose 4,6-dehydratase
MHNQVKVAIISGISGQDAAYLSQLLLSKNYVVIGLTRSLQSTTIRGLEYLKISDKIIIEECNLLDIANIVKLISKYQPQEFYNLGAQSSVGLSFEQPIGTINYNTISVLNILESIRILKLSTKFYQASSSEMFGLVNNLPITLKTPFSPVSPYAISKASAYWIVNNYSASYNIFAANGILFNHESYLRTPNFFVKKIVHGSLDIIHNKVDVLKVGNVDIKRDFGFAKDYVEAMYLALQQRHAGNYIICSGESIYLRDIILYVFKKLNIPESKLIIDSSLYRPSEITDLYGDNSDAKNLLGWNYNKSFYEVLDLILEEEIINYQ